MSHEPHGFFRRLSMLIVAAIWISFGLMLIHVFWPAGDPGYRSHRSDYFFPAVGALLIFVGVRFIITALSPDRRRSQEEEDARGEYHYTWEDRRRLRQWGDD